MQTLPAHMQSAFDSIFGKPLDQLSAEQADREPFDAEYTHRFIEEFSKCEGDPVMWLEDRGVGENYKCKLIDAELLRTIARKFIVAPLDVYAVCGTQFWRTMRELSGAIYDAE